MAFKGLIPGTLGYELKKEFLGNSLFFREVETFNYEIYSTDFQNFSPTGIQQQIKDEFKLNYSGDINVKVFNTNNTLQYPSDSIRASKYTVNVERFRNIQDKNATGDADEGLLIVLNNAQSLLNFKEDFAFSKNNNGNREFNHSLSFNIRESGKNSLGEAGRKLLAQNIASGIFKTDENNDSFSIAVQGLNGDPISLAEISSNKYKNYYTETYDLSKNSYSFSRKREILPYQLTGELLFNLNHSLTMSENGVIEVNEKASNLAKVDFDIALNELDSLYTGSYQRCLDIFNVFHSPSILLEDKPISKTYSLINTPTKLIKDLNKQSLALGYNVTYSNSPEFYESGLMISQTIDFNISEYNKIEMNHSYEYTFNKFLHDYQYFVNNYITGKEQESKTYISDYYQNLYTDIYNVYPKVNLIKTSATLPNIKTKASLRYTYSNDPTHFVTIDGIEFKILDYSVNKKVPNDIVNEYKIINRGTKDKKTVLSYSYQSEKGLIEIKIKASIGRYSNQFYIDGVGSFENIGENNNLKLNDYLKALYKYAGQIFLNVFENPSIAFNWFISDSNFSFDSEGMINVSISYTYTLKNHIQI